MSVQEASRYCLGEGLRLDEVSPSNKFFGGESGVSVSAVGIYIGKVLTKVSLFFDDFR